LRGKRLTGKFTESSEELIINVKWYGHYPLDPFRKKLMQLKISNIKNNKQKIFLSPKFRLFLESIGYVYTFIGFIIKRIVDEISNDMKEEFPSSIYQINIDIYSFILFSHILMDKIPHLINYLVKGETKPKIKSFTSFKKEINKCKGEHIDELKEIINRTSWYKQLDSLRDKAIVHKGRETASLGRTIDDIGIYFHWFDDKNNFNEYYFSNKHVEQLANNILTLLRELDVFFIKYFHEFPIKIEKTS